MSDPKQPDASRRLLSIDETARALNLGRNSVYNLLNQQRLESLRLGRRRLITVSSVDKLLAKGAQ